VLDYLSRYTHRTAIGNERLVAIDGDRIVLRVRADDSGGKRTIGMPATDFVARLLQHVLPPGFKRIRHFGLLAPAAKAQKLAAARAALAMPAANEQAREDAAAFLKRVAGIDIACCPHCKLGQWRTSSVTAPNSRTGSPVACRGTATQWLDAPTSIPAALGNTITSSSRVRIAIVHSRKLNERQRHGRRRNSTRSHKRDTHLCVRHCRRRCPDQAD
jgi:hypothetical protein